MLTTMKTHPFTDAMVKETQRESRYTTLALRSTTFDFMLRSVSRRTIRVLRKSRVNLRHTVMLALVGWYLMVPFSAHGEWLKCDQQTVRHADAEADTLKTWQAIHDSFLRYRKCDDGAIWEGYSYSVVTTLASRWDQLPSLQTLISHDSSFRDFVFRHIDATMPTEDLAAIARNAERRCPTELPKLCAEIRRKALDAETQH
jgi:hypothetical protein